MDAIERARNQRKCIQTSDGRTIQGCRPFRPESSETRQRLDCVKRDGCLTVAAKNDLLAWTCAMCTAYVAGPRIRPLRQYWGDAMPVATDFKVM